jgi:hypothetical protein
MLSACGWLASWATWKSSTPNCFFLNEPSWDTPRTWGSCTPEQLKAHEEAREFGAGASQKRSHQGPHAGSKAEAQEYLLENNLQAPPVEFIGSTKDGLLKKTPNIRLRLWEVSQGPAVVQSRQPSFLFFFAPFSSTPLFFFIYLNSTRPAGSDAFAFRRRHSIFSPFFSLFSSFVSELQQDKRFK